MFTKLKLGLPILDVPANTTVDCPFCSKARSLDQFGSHMFACKHFLALRTTQMHNPMRDTVADVLSQLSKLASCKSSFISSVTIEKSGLIPNTALRPADVYATF